ncbi:NADH dehydrogenase 1 alpha subcomplex assembly factor 3 [Sporodiniella umbellata]|nr:NADH dehydrogenase 1 alpha subcomplex assembly factor 3 [Sporodiniella umbellata]
MFDRGPNVGVEIITKTGGFVLSNNVKVDQPLILLNGSAFLWNPPARTKGHIPMKGWDLECFKIFDIISPRPELVLFGTGKDLAPLPEEVRKYFFQRGMQVDQMNTKHAAATYNVLAEEGRRVALALLPFE